MKCYKRYLWTTGALVGALVTLVGGSAAFAQGAPGVGMDGQAGAGEFAMQPPARGDWDRPPGLEFGPRPNRSLGGKPMGPPLRERRSADAPVDRPQNRSPRAAEPERKPAARAGAGLMDAQGGPSRPAVDRPFPGGRNLPAGRFARPNFGPRIGPGRFGGPFAGRNLGPHRGPHGRQMLAKRPNPQHDPVMMRLNNMDRKIRDLAGQVQQLKVELKKAALKENARPAQVGPRGMVPRRVTPQRRAGADVVPPRDRNRGREEMQRRMRAQSRTGPPQSPVRKPQPNVKPEKPAMERGDVLRPEAKPDRKPRPNAGNAPARNRARSDRAPQPPAPAPDPAPPAE